MQKKGEEQHTLQRYQAFLMTIGLVVPVLVAAALYAILRQYTFYTTVDWYIFSITIDVTITLGVAAIAFSRYYARKNSIIIFIAVAFFSSAILNAIQLFFISPYGAQYITQKSSTVIHWAWLTSHILWALLLGVSVTIWYLRKRYGRKGEVRAGVVYLFVGILTCAAAILFLFLPLPEPYTTLGILPRPWELLPSAIIVLALYGYVRKGEWRNNPFDYWLIIGLLFTLLAHLVFMSQSHAVFDEFFYAAQFMNDIGVIAMAQGMLRSIALLFHEYERKEEELLVRFQELRREKAFDDAMIESIGDGLIVTDSDTRILRVNGAFEAMTGWKGSEVHGEPVTKIIPMLDKEGLEVPYEQRAQAKALFAGQKVTLDMDFSYKRKDLTAFPVSATVTPIILDGEIIGAIELFRDVTREKMIDDQKSTFVSVASHQLRTPLTSMNWYTEMLLSEDAGKINKEQREFLDEIYQGSKRMVVLVNDLLNVSRIETGRMKIDPQPTDVPALIDNAIEEVKPLSKDKSVQIVLEKKGKADFTKMLMDASLLRQVVHNLLTNAIRYSPSEKATITVTLEYKKYSLALRRKASPVPPGEYMLISVADQGIGIPKEQQSRIFQKFFRADNAIHAAADGSGLGLYFLKMIIDEAGGAVWFVSKEGKGTTFTVAIPMKGMKKKDGEKGMSLIDREKNA